jgi:phosphatidylserine/phosphatidylglycerophosphate/cardiolipin synthase-like enzyme
MKVLIGCFLLFVLLLVAGRSSEASRRKSRLVQALSSFVDEATVIPPVDREVCFSPEERCDLKLVRFVESAKNSIDLAVFDINLDQLVHSLLVASKRGVRVRVLVDARQAKGAYSLASTLKKGGIKVRRGRQRGLMHHKFTIVDGKRIETGSFNYTNHATKAKQENQVYLDDSGIVSRFVVRFELSWGEAKEWGD